MKSRQKGVIYTEDTAEKQLEWLQMIFDKEWLRSKKNLESFYESAIEKIVHERFYAELHLSPALNASWIPGVNENSILVFKLKQCLSLSLIPDEDLMENKEVVVAEAADLFLGIEVISLKTIEEWIHLNISCFNYELAIICRDIELHIQ